MTDLEKRVLALEMYVSRLSRKNESGLFGNLGSENEKEFISDLFDKYPSLRRVVRAQSSKTNKGKFRVPLITKDPNKYHGLWFVVSTKDGKTFYCTAYNKSNDEIKSVENIAKESAIDKVALFILERLKSEESKKESKRILEYVSLNDFDCEKLDLLITKALSEYDVEVDVNEENAVYGMINVGISSEFTDDIVYYDVIADDYNKFTVQDDNKVIGKCNSVDKVVSTIKNHYVTNYVK